MIIDYQGTIAVFTAENKDDLEWLEDTHNEPWQWLGKSLVVDWRLALNLERELQEAGIEMVRKKVVNG